MLENFQFLSFVESFVSVAFYLIHQNDLIFFFDIFAFSVLHQCINDFIDQLYLSFFNIFYNS